MNTERYPLSLFWLAAAITATNLAYGIDPSNQWQGFNLFFAGFGACGGLFYLVHRSGGRHD